MIVGSASPDR